MTTEICTAIFLYRVRFSQRKEQLSNCCRLSCFGPVKGSTHNHLMSSYRQNTFRPKSLSHNGQCQPHHEHFRLFPDRYIFCRHLPKITLVFMTERREGRVLQCVRKVIFNLETQFANNYNEFLFGNFPNRFSSFSILRNQANCLR